MWKYEPTFNPIHPESRALAAGNAGSADAGARDQAPDVLKELWLCLSSICMTCDTRCLHPIMIQADASVSVQRVISTAGYCRLLDTVRVYCTAGQMLSC